MVHHPNAPCQQKVTNQETLQPTSERAKQELHSTALVPTSGLLLGSSSDTTEESQTPSDTKRQDTSRIVDPRRSSVRDLLISATQKPRGRKLLRSLKRRLHHLSIALRVGKKRTGSGSCQTPSPIVSLEAEKPSQRMPGGAEHPRAIHHDSSPQRQQDSLGAPNSQDTRNNAGIHHCSKGKATSISSRTSSPFKLEQHPGESGDKNGLSSTHPQQNQIVSATSKVESTAVIQTLGSDSSTKLADETASSPEFPKRRKWKRWFHMVIHLANDENAMRVTCLDTGADIDVISIHVVESLGLAREKYQGPRLKPIGGTYLPEWQVTFDWHVAKFHRTYSRTFAVLDEEHSGDFDILLGRVTVEDIEFYHMNDKVWFSPSNDEEELQTSVVIDGAKHNLPSIEVDG